MRFSWEKDSERGNVVYYVLKDKGRVTATCAVKNDAVVISELLNFLEMKKEGTKIMSKLLDSHADNKEPETCLTCDVRMIGSYWQGVRVDICLNKDCDKNNNDRNYCHCDHMHTLHEGMFGICLVEGCLCDAWNFMCTEKVWDAWHPVKQKGDSVND